MMPEGIVLIVENDPAGVERDLLSGGVLCPWCGGVLAPWSFARRRCKPIRRPPCRRNPSASAENSAARHLDPHKRSEGPQSV